MRRSLTILAVGALSGPALAQFIMGFEPPIVADDAGILLTGQDDWYIPVAGSSDYNAYTYQNNALNVPQNPEGDDQFIGGLSLGGTAFARAQRDVGFAFADVIAVSYDVLARYDGTLPATQNLGSFSTNPFLAANPQTHACYNQLNTWVNVATADAWHARYLAFNAAGAMDAQPGREPGSEWSNLEVNVWYRLRTVINFNQNRITEVSIQKVGGAVTTVQPVDYYLAGGQAGGLPRTTAVRFFAGGTTLGNLIAADNLRIEAVSVPCPGDLDGDGDVDQSDLGILLSDYGCVSPPEPDCPGDADGDGDTDQSDLGILLGAYGAVCR